jgi:pantoate--beta-alanine ligase
VDVIHTVSGLRERLRGEASVAFVPTMGNLHAGHLSLIELAKKKAQCVVSSIFVNRLQFEPGGDFDRYPRTLERDCEMLRVAGCHVVFAPDEAELYPEPQEIRLTAPKAADQLCGPYRPGHFEGVLTVVCKLFDIVCPQVAVFGSKDYQQLHLIRMMVRQLNFGIEIISGDTVREADGLAMSSRNGYLNAAERKTAVGLYTNLKRIKDAIEGGSREYDALRRDAIDALDADGWRVDYVELRDAGRLEAPKPEDMNLRVIGAAWLGKTRLIDNLEIRR